MVNNISDTIITTVVERKILNEYTTNKQCQFWWQITRPAIVKQKVISNSAMKNF